MKAVIQAALVFVCLAVFGTNMFGNAESKSADTTINEVSFRLKLPGQWMPGNSDDPTKRTYHTESEQLTVSIFGSMFEEPGKMNHDGKVVAFRHMVNKRRDVETRMPGFHDVTVTEPLFGESRATLAARYAGFDPKRQRRFHCLILASSSAFEIFYYEAIDMAEPLVEERAKAIFNSVDIPE